MGPCSIDTVLTANQVADLTGDKEDAYKRLWRGLKTAGLDPASTFDWDPNRPPYPGMLAFQEEDAAVFFGRDNEIREGLEALNRLRQFGGARMLVVLGASGSGKSSLVRAGLLPLLRMNEDQWLVVPPFRPQEHPLRELAIVLAEAFNAFLKDKGETTSWEKIRKQLNDTALSASGSGDPLNDLARDLQLAANRREARVLLVIDQTEELLHSSRSDEANSFLLLLQKSLSNPSSPLLAVCTLRSDFLGDFQQHPALRELAFQSIHFGPMGRDQFEKVIEGPAEKAAIKLESGLSRVMVDDTETKDALPLLAFTLRELYERYSDDGLLTLEEYRDRLGGLAGSVAKAAEAVFAGEPLSGQRQADLRKAFLKMVRINKEGHFVRQIAYWRDLPVSVQEVLERLVRARLLVSRGEGDDKVLEVAHEALFSSWEPLKKWLDENREFLLWLERLRVNLKGWKKRESNEDALLRGALLSEAIKWLNDRADELAPDEKAFIEESKRVRDHWRSVRRHRRRRVIIASIGAAIFSSILAGLFFFEKSIADKEKNNAFSRQLATQAEIHLEAWPPRSLLLAIGSLMTALQGDGTTTPVAENTLRNLLSFVGGRPLSGHSREVVSLAFDPDGHWLATASSDKTVRLWRLDDPKAEPRVLRGHTGVVWTTAFDPGGQWLGTGSRDGTAILWSLKDPKAAPRVLRGHKGDVLSVAFDPAGQWFATGGLDGMVMLWRLDRLHESPIAWPGHGASVKGLTFSPNGRWLASGHIDKTVRLWSMDNPQVEPLVLVGHEKSVLSIDFDPSGQWLATGSKDRTILLWDLSNPKAAPLVLRGHEGSVVGLDFDPKGRWLAAGSQDQTVRLWNLAKPRAAPKVLRGHEGEVTSVAVGPQGRWLATAGRDKTVRLWRLEDLTAPTLVLRGHEKDVVSLAFDPNGQLLATGSNDHTARVWSLPDPVKDPWLLRGHEDRVTTVVMDPKGKWLASGSWDGMVRLWDLAEPRSNPRVLRGHQGKVVSMAFDSRSGRLASGGSEGNVYLWNLDKGSSEPLLLKGHKGEVVSLLFDPQGRWLATGSRDNTARLWFLTQPESESLVLQGHEEDVEAIAIDPGGRWLATGSWDGTVGLWDLADPGGDPRVLRGHDGQVQVVAFDPSGQWLASGSSDETVRLWNVAEPSSAPVVLGGHEGRVLSLAFDQEGERLATGSWDGKARVWTLTDPKANPMLLLGHAGYVGSVVFAPDGKKLATGSWDGTVRIWDLAAAGAEPLVLSGDGSVVKQVAFTLDGNRLAAGSWDGIIRLWNLDLDELINRACNIAGRNLSCDEWKQYFGNLPYQKTCDFPMPEQCSNAE